MRTTPTTPPIADIEKLTALFKLLADPTRLSILMQLSSGEVNVSTLCEVLGLPQPSVSHHLGLLREGNVIASRRDGKQVFYSLSEPLNDSFANQQLVNGAATSAGVVSGGLSVRRNGVVVRVEAGAYESGVN